MVDTFNDCLLQIGNAGTSCVIGTAYQIAAVACLSQKALALPVGRLLGGKDAADLILAAIGLLNIKLAMIACFTALMFLSLVLSFVWNKCNTTKFTSARGTLTFNIWVLIYEKIETSTVASVLHNFCSSDQRRSPAPADEAPPDEDVPTLASLAFPTERGRCPVPPAQRQQEYRSREGGDTGGFQTHMVETVFVNLLDSKVQASTTQGNLRQLIRVGEPLPDVAPP